MVTERERYEKGQLEGKRHLQLVWLMIIGITVTVIGIVVAVVFS